MSESIVSLAALRREHLALAGGKAANLGELIAAGLPVPPGFCLTTAAYHEVAADAAVRAAIAGLAQGGAAEAVRAALLAAPVPPAIAAALAGAYMQLGEQVVVAVRSSATAEDLPDASFAGQQDTILGVRGEAGLIAAVRRCWSSLFSDRAVAYRAQRGIAPESVELAVVVQRLVPASVAGVLFTADPVLGRRGRAVIDASPGLGEAVVSGAVNPDHFVVEGEVVVVRQIGDKRLRIDADADADDGGTRQVGLAASDEACVSDAELHELVALGRRIEAHYGAPQDIEWALDGARRPAILQARPITTLYPLPEGAPAPPALSVYFNFNVAQGVLRPLTLMGIQCWRLFMGGVLRKLGFAVPVEAGPGFIKDVGHRLVFDLSAALRHPVGRKLVVRVFSKMEARSAAVIRTLLEDPRLAAQPSSRFATVKAVVRGLWRTRAPLRLLAALWDPEAARRGVATRVTALLAAGETADDLRPAARLAAIERMLVAGFPGLFVSVIPVMAAGLLSLEIARRLIGERATAAEFEATLRALPHNPTTEMDLELWAMSQRLAADPEASAALRTETPAALARRFHAGSLPAALRVELTGFLATYGARGVAEIDVGVARWGEDPTHVFGVLANYLAHADPALAADLQFERGRAAAEAAMIELTARVGWWRRPLLRLAFGRMRGLAGVRELPKFAIVRLLARSREHLQAIGATLVAAGRIERVEDVFMLDLPGVRAGLGGADLRAQVAARRAGYTRELERRHSPRVLLSDGTDAEALLVAAQPEGGLAGTPASAGRVTGVARVILDPAGARIEPGEILVAPSTDPGWTPLFLTASGLVMEMGGAMSHGSVVAREYGIPAVVGVPQATTRISTGQRITVDGAAGTITIETDR
ncbi:MAG: phosphoenolpyruvate synthase [Nannocystis sp.]|uniref:PEP/pyruvate-binding domain-containing protein n=1 Tax=Nannocystis sp. TaxID=1962667 RepID=UPI002420D670|nr:PEP/pyruvate-binding domain-containing protein [Nannocystis sp.]MBK9752067.1 phosphoenolpyruvate synthase [Nannocystis sp.]